MLKYFLLVLATLVLPCQSGSGVLCPLRWVSSSGGEFPDDSIEIGNGDLIARVKISNAWIAGRLTPGETAFIPTPGITFDTYEVLTNVDSCILTWTSSTDGVPSTVVTTGSSGSYIGRGIYDGFIIGGTSTEVELVVAYAEGIHPLDEFEILSSEYPFIHVSLSDFSFDADDIKQLESGVTYNLFGIEVIANQVPDVQLTYSINHSQQFEEIFQVEESREWQGVDTSQYNLQLWFGSPIITETVSVKDDLTSSMTRERHLAVETSLTILNVTNISYCSFAGVSSRTAIVKYTATARFHGDMLSGDEVKKIVQATGRVVSSVQGDKVISEVSGSLSGKFYVRTKTLTKNVEVGGTGCETI